MSFTEEELQRLLFQSEQALLALYSGQNQNERDVAHKWLLTTQKSPQAWQLCWRLMQRDKATEIQFFGASMLHFKISKNW
ncbi:PREDICTED: importin-13-like [Acropora digitifera]|uniref:importin-13-like n=1 Tax=Acropora digitifera TaxID=70779 RepID=UPI00077ABD14|nr:PREDICTED: importin-13-like [Acropora digitifera]